MDRPATATRVSPVAADEVADPSRCAKPLAGPSGSSLDDDPYREDGVNVVELRSGTQHPAKEASSSSARASSSESSLTGADVRSSAGENVLPPGALPWPEVSARSLSTGSGEAP